jgi:hypothetical protein
METKAAAKFAPLLLSHAAEGLDVMRRERDLRYLRYLQFADGMGALSAQEKIAVMLTSRVELSDA